MTTHTDFINKKVTIQIPFRDEKGKVIDRKFTEVTGICSFYGYNDILNCTQITLNRMPIYPINLNQIKVW